MQGGNGKRCIASPGSETMACWILGIYGNPGDPVESFRMRVRLVRVITKRESAEALQGVGQWHSTYEAG
jgi:hypothetical protein